MDGRAIAEVKQHSQRSVNGWATKIYYLELLRASKARQSVSPAAFAMFSTH
jgi:hypothetical protein